MKCPNCNAVIEEKYNFCPKCRTKLKDNATIAKTKFEEYIKNTDKEGGVLKDRSLKQLYAEGYNVSLCEKSKENPEENEQKFRQMLDLVKAEKEHSPFTIIKNKAIWRIEKGEVVRHIDEAEFANFDQVSGLIINEGVTAVIYVNGKKMKELSGGIYEFVSPAEIEYMMSQRIDTSFNTFDKFKETFSIRGAGKTIWRNVIKFCCGKKVGEVVNKDKSNDNLRTIDDVIRSLNEKTFISVYLKLDRAFPVLCGTKNGSDFLPITIKTKYLDAEFGVSMLVKIDDFDLFIKQYMADKSSITIDEIQKILKNSVAMILKDELRNEEIDGHGISKEARNRIMLRLMALTETLQGLQIVNVGDITCSNQDFERLRGLARELYCSEQELSYLKRINEFKNRLVGVENAQLVQEAKNDLELMKALDVVNRDKLLFQDEQEKFCMLLSRQKRIREAQNEMEVSKALSDIKRTELLNEDEFEEFEQSLRLGKFERNNIHEAMRLQSLTVLKKKEIELNAEVIKYTIGQESDIENTQFNAWKQETAHASEKVDILDSLYGKEHVSNRNRLLEMQELTSLHKQFIDSQELADAENQNKRLLENIKGRQLEDEYAWQKGRRDYLFEEEKKDNDWTRTVKRQEDIITLEEKRVKLQQEKLANSLNALNLMNEAAHRRKLEEEAQRHKQHFENEEAIRQAKIVEESMKHQQEMRRLENEGNYSAEQLFVSKLDADTEAARIYASKFSSENKYNAMLEAQKKIDEERARMDWMRNENEERYRTILEQQQKDTKSMMSDMMDFAKYSMNVNAGVANNAVRGQQENEREHFNRYERVSTYRMGELGDYSNQRMDDIRIQKEEYREQMKYEQQRHDIHQDRALNYTTKVTEAEYRPPHQPSLDKGKQTEYYIEKLGPVPFQLVQLKAFAQSGIITESTIVQVSGMKCYAGDLVELKDIFK